MACGDAAVAARYCMVIFLFFRRSASELRVRYQ